MSVSTRALLCLFASSLALGQSGCNLVPNTWLRQSQLQLRDLHGQNKALADQNAAAAQSLAQLQKENEDAQKRLQIANSRLDNLNSERDQMKNRFVSLQDQLKNLQNPLPQSANQKFADLAKKYPGFNFDPDTGVSKFSSDILFDSGSANIKSSANQLLKDFAKIMNEGEAKRLNILVVGHTDDKPISKASTKSQHPTNWHLSTNRADSVVVDLGKAGLAKERMGAAGYADNQPVVPNTNDKARSQNRRVEIFVLAPEAAIAGWDPIGNGNSPR
ncbi:MAG: OmpA family protein [Rhodopirellula sp.]|nr:OmpA family protein [Rhodopirellula sp.]